ncbi:hypothetical protein ACFZDJ_01595 [Streptomyces sp. NPDC007896]|uniref:hypothetical protein n=1 Tax=Streptomyces sp. NPDC007896 TaxID=3364784 RepID=UPI0036EFB621
MDRAVPGTDLSVDVGREGERQPMKSLKGGCAAPNVQRPWGDANTGSPARDRSNDTWEDSASSGYLGNANSSYSGTP